MVKILNFASGFCDAFLSGADSCGEELIELTDDKTIQIKAAMKNKTKEAKKDRKKLLIFFKKVILFAQKKRLYR